MLRPYQYMGETPRYFDCEGGEKRSLFPLKTYLLNDADWHVKAWVRRELLVYGLLEDVEPETGLEGSGETMKETPQENAHIVRENDVGESGIKGGNSAYALPDYVDESEADFFYFGWSQSKPIRLEKQDRQTAQSSRLAVPETMLFVSAWQRRKTLNEE